MTTPPDVPEWPRENKTTEPLVLSPYDIYLLSYAMLGARMHLEDLIGGDDRLVAQARDRDRCEELYRIFSQWTPDAETTDPTEGGAFVLCRLDAVAKKE